MTSLNKIQDSKFQNFTIIIIFCATVRDLSSQSETSLTKQLSELENSVRQIKLDHSETSLKSNLESSLAMKDALRQVKTSELYCILQPKLMDEEFWAKMDDLEQINDSNIEVNILNLLALQNLSLAITQSLSSSFSG